MDIFQCISDVSSLKTEIQRFLASNVTMESLIDEIGVLQPLLQSSLVDCGITNATLPSLLSLKSEQVPFSFDFMACLSDLNTLATLAGSLSADVTTGNIINIVNDLVALHTDVLALLSDCAVNASVTVKGNRRVLTSRPVGGVLDCFSDITDRLVPDVQTFINVTKSGQIGDIIAILNVLLNDINATLADCQLGRVARIDSLVARLNSISPLDCLSDVSNLVNLAETIVQNVEASQYEELISNLEQFVSSVEQTIQDCTGSNSTLTFVKEEIADNANSIVCIGEIADFAGSLRSFVEQRTSEAMNVVLRQARIMVPACGVNSTLVQRILRIDPIACFEDLESLLALVNQTLADAESLNVVSLISDVESLVSSVETALVDCTGANMTKTYAVTADILACVSDVETTVLNVNVLLEAIKIGNYSQVLPLVNAIIDDVNLILTDCGFNSSVQKIKNIYRIDPIACFEDLESLLALVNQTLADAESLNVVSLISDVESLVSSVETALVDCTGANMTKTYAVTADILACVSDVETTVLNVNVLLEAIKIGNYSQVLPLVNAIIDDVNLILTDCGFNSSVQKFDRKLNIDIEQCFYDVENVVSVVTQIATDVQGQNWLQLIQDVESAVSTVQQLGVDCLDYNVTLFQGECYDDVINVVNDVVAVVGRIGNMTGSLDEIMEIIEQVGAIVDEVESLEADCGLNLTLVRSQSQVMFLALGQEENTCSGSIMKLGKALLDVISGTDMIEKMQKIFMIKNYIEDVKTVCLGGIKTPESIVSYVAAKGLRL